ncbi:DUF3291 domain-containing protein [Nocardia sp. KC 131]|uniref:DUF3291 domain-containing protein n=1 Tax=Nocardia arseniciresistens TaxID=3392119 RepID=UPI00398E4388
MESATARSGWVNPGRAGAFYLGLWWIPAGQIPTLDDALARLQALRANGPSPLPFSLRENYTAEDAQAFA